MKSFISGLLLITFLLGVVSFARAVERKGQSAALKNEQELRSLVQRAILLLKQKYAGVSIQKGWDDAMQKFMRDRAGTAITKKSFDSLTGVFVANFIRRFDVKNIREIVQVTEKMFARTSGSARKPKALEVIEKINRASNSADRQAQVRIVADEFENTVRDQFSLTVSAELNKYQIEIRYPKIKRAY